MDEGKGRRRRGTRYLWGARSDVVIQQRLGGPCAPSCQLGGQARFASDGADVRQALKASLPSERASAEWLISRTHNTLRRPYKTAPPPNTSKQSIVSTLHARHQLNHTPQLTKTPPTSKTNPPTKNLQNDWRQIRRQGQRLQVQRPIVSFPSAASRPALQFALRILHFQFASFRRVFCEKMTRVCAT